MRRGARRRQWGRLLAAVDNAGPGDGAGRALPCDGSVPTGAGVILEALFSRYLPTASLMTRRSCWAVAVLLGAAPLAAQQPAPLYTLDTLQVSVGSRTSPELPVATRGVEILTAAQLRAFPGRTLAELLGGALGVDVMPRSAAQSDLAVRGATFEQVLVLVDGVRMSDAQTGHFDLNLAVPLEQVERVEVLRGDASALYGADALGGVVNLVTRAGGGRSLQVRGEAGSFGTRTLALAARAGRPGGAQLDVAGDFTRSDGHRPGTDYDALQARAALRAPLAGRTLHLDAGSGRRDFGAAQFYGNYPSYEETRVLTASAAWLADPAARASLEPRLSVRRHADDFILKREDPAFYRNQHTSWQAGGELVGRYRITPALRLALGGEAYLDELSSNSLGERNERRAAAFSELAAGEFGRAALTAGLRADWHSAFGGFVSPSLAGAWWPQRALRLRASASRAFRAPTWTERYYRSPAQLGDATLDPERAWSAELGADLAPGAGVRLGIGGFMRWTDAMIDWARPRGADPKAVWTARNVKDVLTRGLELEASVAELLGVRLGANAMLLSLQSDDARGWESRYALRPLKQSWALSADRALGGGLALGARVRGARRAGEDAHRLLDARLRYALGGAELFLDAQNLTDTRYVDIVGQPAPGRTLTLGLSWGSEQ